MNARLYSSHSLPNLPETCLYQDLSFDIINHPDHTVGQYLSPFESESYRLIAFAVAASVEERRLPYPSVDSGSCHYTQFIDKSG